MAFHIQGLDRDYDRIRPWLKKIGHLSSFNKRALEKKQVAFN